MRVYKRKKNGDMIYIIKIKGTEKLDLKQKKKHNLQVM